MLEVKSVTKRFGGVVANNNVSFSVDEGQIVGLIGPNGAGKSTMFHMISSVIAPSEGSIVLRDQPIEQLPPFKVAPLGISRTFQNLQVFANMTVIENVMVGQHMKIDKNISGVLSMILGTSKREKQVYDEAMEYLKFFHLENLYDQKASSLSLGKLRLLEFARAYATRPQLLLLDEIAAGLNHSETLEMSKLISKVRNTGVTILVVEHDMDLVMNICDKIIVLDQGKKIAEGTAKEIQSNQAVIEAYLGADIEEEVV